MAESLLAVSPVNSQSGAILTFAFPMLLFIVVALVLWGLFGRFRPARADRFQTAIAEASSGTLTAPQARAAGADESPAPSAAADDSPTAAETAQESAAPDGTASDGTQ